MEVPNKQLYRAIKYVWNPEWIGDDAFKSEIKAAKAACIAEVLTDWVQDHDINTTEAQQKLTAMHIAKYADFKVFMHIDKCYSKVLLEVMLDK